MGEGKFEQRALVKAIGGTLAEQSHEAAELRVTTPGGRFQVRWDENGSASAMGQLAFFAEFLDVSGLFERWAESCPMAYTCPNAPDVQDILGKLRQTSGVKQFIERHWSREDWQDVGQGCQAVVTELTLSGWSRARRVVVLRRAVKETLIAEARASKRTKRQRKLQFAEPLQPVKLWEYTVLVTNADYDLDAIGQLYRDRADCENGFDELKNQWGWGGYTTQDMERCNLSARAVALIYNWWSWYVRLAHPQTRLEAITTRPLLLTGVARLTQHAGQSRLLLTLTHGASDQIKAMIANVRHGLDTILATAPQLTKPERWSALVRYIIAKIIEAASKVHPPPTPVQVTSALPAAG